MEAAALKRLARDVLAELRITQPKSRLDNLPIALKHWRTLSDAISGNAIVENAKRIGVLERSDKVVSDFIIENGNRIDNFEEIRH